VRAWPHGLVFLLNPVLTWVFARDTRKRLAALKAAVEERGLLGIEPEGTVPQSTMNQVNKNRVCQADPTSTDNT
jgi:hypothetical protein